MGFVILNSQIVAGEVGDKIQITSSNIICTERVREQGSYFMLYLMNNSSTEVKKFIDKDSKGKCQAIAVTYKDKFIGKIIGRKKSFVSKESIDALAKDVPFEYFKFKILSVDGKNIEDELVVRWLVMFDIFSDLPMYKIIK